MLVVAQAVVAVAQVVLVHHSQLMAVATLEAVAAVLQTMPLVVVVQVAEPMLVLVETLVVLGV
jgi:hypothetical protein